MARRARQRHGKRKKTSKVPPRTWPKKKKETSDLIISKSRTKGAAEMNVSGEFYGALDKAVRELIANAEERARENGRKTLRPGDL